GRDHRGGPRNLPARPGQRPAQDADAGAPAREPDRHLAADRHLARLQRAAGGPGPGAGRGSLHVRRPGEELSHAVWRLTCSQSETRYHFPTGEVGQESTMARDSEDVAASWRSMVEALRLAGERMDEGTRSLSPDERADGFRALARALANQVNRLEVDDANPDLDAFNLWRHKFYMDNPDFLYWVAEIRDDATYRIDGAAPGARFVSVNVYAGAGLVATTVARTTSDEMNFDGQGRFSLTLRPEGQEAAVGDIALPEGANMLWVRQFYDAPPSVEASARI